MKKYYVTYLLKFAREDKFMLPWQVINLMNIEKYGENVFMGKFDAIKYTRYIEY